MAELPNDPKSRNSKGSKPDRPSRPDEKTRFARAIARAELGRFYWSEQAEHDAPRGEEAQAEAIAARGPAE